MMDYINWLSHVEPALHNLNKSHFVVVNNLLEHCWIWLVNMLLRVFTFMFMRYFGLCMCVLSHFFSSVAESWLTLCDPMDCSTLDFHVHHHIPKLAQTHVHQCHPTISSSVISYSPFLQPFPTSGSSPLSQLFPPSGQSIGDSASASVLPMNIQDWFPLGLTSWISLQSKGLSRIFSNTTVQSINSSVISFLYSATFISTQDYLKNHSFD